MVALVCVAVVVDNVRVPVEQPDLVCVSVWVHLVSTAI